MDGTVVRYSLKSREPMTANIDLSYSQIRSIVMQMPSAERKMLFDELRDLSLNEHSLLPYSIDELNARMDEAEDDIRNNRYFVAEDMHAQLEQKYPWLCK